MLDHLEKENERYKKLRKKFTGKYAKSDPFIKGEKYPLGEYLGRSINDCFVFSAGGDGNDRLCVNHLFFMEEKYIDKIVSEHENNKIPRGYH